LLTFCREDIIAALGEIRSMLESQSTGALSGAIEDILKLAHLRGKTRSLREAESFIRSVVELDYGAAMKKHFDRRQVKSMLAEMRRALPTLNLEMYRVTEVGGLSQKAADLGVVLKAHAFKGADATGLRGFYVNEAEVLKRPLIWVNTATHPTAMAASFWHEVGHHLTNRIWGTRQHRSSLTFGANYHDDFADPKEIAADMVRVMAGYPKATAERLFGGPSSAAITRNADQLVATARPYMRSAMGFDFNTGISPRENLYYLGGIIHVAKLRTTLLSEYGI
jgi:alkylation response protein AidB-like acyl-CoA dehydrogenase